MLINIYSFLFLSLTCYSTLSFKNKYITLGALSPGTLVTSAAEAKDFKRKGLNMPFWARCLRMAYICDRICLSADWYLLFYFVYFFIFSPYPFLFSILILDYFKFHSIIHSYEFSLWKNTIFFDILPTHLLHCQVSS